MISTRSFESLVPDFMMESMHFYLVILDIEGKVVKFNRSFKKVNPSPIDTYFWDFLSPSSASEFSCSLEMLLGTPKIRRHLMLDHPESDGVALSKVWWEFSVVTTLDMDLSGVIGIGVDMQLLEQEMPWNSLVDVLGFGKIVLDRDFNIQTWDGRILEWFDPLEENWGGMALMDTPAFHGLIQLSEVLEHTSHETKPKCFLIKANSPKQPAFAALLASSADGYHLFLVPKEISPESHPEKSLIPMHVLASLPGAVFVLDKAGKLSQQNEAAKNLGRIWKGRAYSEGFALTFPTQPNRFSKLLRAIEESKIGVSTDMELKMLMPGQESDFWSASVRPISFEGEVPEGVLIQVFDLTYLRSQLVQTNRENERLRELALSPSHILRGPLSSMIGLLELIDAKQLDKENQKLFSYLKPLTKELDQTIRQHAKKMSTFD